jgi:hypothetical protein
MARCSRVGGPLRGPLLFFGLPRCRWPPLLLFYAGRDALSGWYSGLHQYERLSVSELSPRRQKKRCSYLRIKNE